MSRLPVLLSALALIAVPAVAPGVALAQANTLSIEIDRASRVQLPGAAASVIVGNPQIADVSVVDANTLFITGKGYGVTEVIAVDAIGRTLFQREVVVTGGSTGSVRVWRGGQATEMACAASCAPSVRAVGDTGAVGAPSAPAATATP
ncbi:MAG: pilus assembly protein CpaC [Brevundimonas sp.]|uniref:pilus assembly protein N-terminal domain-containing protein n=1 Tax=Brevundimonas sp. TaxID=1871086 RepID=UPI000DBC15F6|nr:pilus assembly protein N-terminal domain-containing protein [Brevundimonas sp.]PZU60874.1 MAG: pilus assembly protein CpaC [Brevundimonas sp.]